MKDSFTGKVVVIHQPAEEVPPGGAKTMIENGVLDGVDHAIRCTRHEHNENR